MIETNDEEFSVKTTIKGRRSSKNIKLNLKEEKVTFNKAQTKPRRKSRIVESIEDSKTKIDVKRNDSKNSVPSLVTTPTRTKVKTKRKSVFNKNSIEESDSTKNELKHKEETDGGHGDLLKEEEPPPIQLDIKSKRKSLMNDKMLMKLAKNEINNEKKFEKSVPVDENKGIQSKKRKTINVNVNSISELRLKLEEDKKNENNANNKGKVKHKGRRKSTMLRPILELNNYIALKAQLVDTRELIVKQESDIIEAMMGCQRPNNYHIYSRERDGELTYLYKFREFSGCLMRFFCPVNCREFTMKMKLVQSYENKNDNNFDNSIMKINKDCKIPFLCLIRPDMHLFMEKDDEFIGTVEQNFSIFDPCFTVYNGKEEEVKYIEADCWQCGFVCRNSSLGKTDDVHFYIYNSNDRHKPIGEICKKTESVFSIADIYSIIFPPEIPPEEKILLSVVSMLIDYQYFEKNTNVK